MKLWSFGKKIKNTDQKTQTNLSFYRNVLIIHTSHTYTSSSTSTMEHSIWRERQQQRPKRKITKRQINVDRPMQDKKDTHTNIRCMQANVELSVPMTLQKRQKKNRRNEIDEASFFPCKCLLLKMVCLFSGDNNRCVCVYKSRLWNTWIRLSSYV